MADTGVTINVRERGAKQTAAAVGRNTRELDKLGRTGKAAAVGLRASSNATRGLGSALGSIGGSALYAGAALGGGLAFGLKRSYDAFDESRQIASDTRAVIKSTGGVANVTAKDIDTLSGALARRNAVDDESIQQGANVLATFKGVRNEVGKGNKMFDRASQAAIDLSARMGTDLKGGFLQVGKALDNPTKGITALRKAGVGFTEQQVDQIKALQKSGDMLGAQRIVIRELEGQVKGSAAAQATPLKKLAISWGDVEEKIGKGVAPAVDAVATEVDTFVRKATPKIEAFSDTIGSIFGSKDLTLENKIRLSGAEVRDVFSPYSAELKRELRDANLGPALGKAVTNATPEVLEAMGKASGQAALAFGKGVLKADLFGQAFIAAVILKKLGAFSAIGSAAMGKFAAGWRGRAGKTSLAMPQTGAPVAAPAGAPAGGPVVAGGPTGQPVRGLPGGAPGLVPAGVDGQLPADDPTTLKLMEQARKSAERKKRAKRRERLPIPTGLDIFGDIRVRGASSRTAARPPMPADRPRAVQPQRRRKETSQVIILKADGRELARVVNQANAAKEARR